MSTTGAERTRRYRQRIEQGVQLVTVPVSASAVYTLARLRFLPDVDNVDGAKLGAALADLLRWAAQQRGSCCPLSSAGMTGLGG
jgi:hypothetical protein